MNKLLAFVLVLIVAGGAWLGTRLAPGSGHPSAQVPTEERAPGDAPNGDLGTEVAELRRRLARLEQGEVARGQTAGQALRAETAAAAEKTARKATLDKIRRHYTPELEAKMFAGYFGTLDEKRRTEGVDPMWAGDMNALFRRRAGGDGALASLNVQTVDCGRTLCRVELKSSNDVEKQLAISELLMKVSAELPEASVQVVPGSNQVTAYFARTGTELPAIQSPERLVADLP